MKIGVRLIVLALASVAAVIVSALLYLQFFSTIGPSIDFLDVGQGDAILIRQDRDEMLIDGGPDRSVLARLGESLSFLDRRLEYVVATHPHDDHTKGLFDILKRYEVGVLILPAAFVGDSGYTRLLESAEAGGVEVKFVSTGDRFTVGESSLEVIWPDSDCREWLKSLHFDSGEHDPANICSLVMRYEYCFDGSCSIALLMADATGLSEEIMVDQGRVGSADLLKIGHHGSRFATISGFLKAARPKDAVIQVGQNRFGHPDLGVLLRLKAAGVKVWRNDTNGNVRAVPATGGGFTVTD